LPGVLEKYKHDTRVMHISGNNYLNGWRKDNDYSYYFSDKVNAWGWATWRRAWQLFDFNQAYPELKEKGYLKGLFLNKFEETYRLSQLEKDVRQHRERRHLGLSVGVYSIQQFRALHCA
jgi:hypothetical protein